MRHLSVSPEHFVLVRLAMSKAGVGAWWMIRRLMLLHDLVDGEHIAHTEGWM